MSNSKPQDNTSFMLIGLLVWGVFGFIFASFSMVGLFFGIFVYWAVFSLFLKKRLSRSQYRFFLFGVFILAVGLLFFGNDFLPVNEKTHKIYFGWVAKKEVFYNVYAMFVQFWYGKISGTAYLQQFIFPVLTVGLGVCGWIGVFMLLVSKETAQERLWRMQKEKKAHIAKKTNFSGIKKTKFTNKYGVALGVSLWEKSGKQVIGVPYSLLNRHTCLVGTTGSGKTTTLMRFLESGLANDKAVVFVDGKGDLGIVEAFKKLCTKYGKKANVITLIGSEVGYNPFKQGTPTELTDKIIGLFDWSEEHYKLGATRFIQLLIQYMQMQKIPMSLGNIVNYADTKILTNFHIKANQPATLPAEPEERVSLASDSDPLAALLSPDVSKVEETPQKTPQAERKPLQSESDILFEKIRGIEEKTKSGIRDRLATLAEGDMASLFTNTNALSLSEEIENCGCVLFSIDSLSYPLQSKGVGRLVVNDLKSTVPLHARNGNKPVTVIFDEFNVFASHEVIDVINKSRSAGYEALLSFQSLSDIDKLENGEALRRQIIQNCNTLIVQTQNDSKDAEELSALFGTFETIETTVQEQEITAFAGAGSARMVHEYRVHPDDIKMLSVGEAFIKSPEFIDKIKVYREEV